MPEVNRVGVVVVAEREVAEHFEVGEMGAVADEVDVVGAEARLESGDAAAVEGSEPFFVGLHAAADKQGAGVVWGRQ